MESTRPGVEQVRAQMLAQIKQMRTTLTFKLRLSMENRMAAAFMLYKVIDLVATAEQEVPAQPHAEAFEKFKAAM